MTMLSQITVDSCFGKRYESATIEDDGDSATTIEAWSKRHARQRDDNAPPAAKKNIYM